MGSFDRKFSLLCIPREVYHELFRTMYGHKPFPVHQLNDPTQTRDLHAFVGINLMVGIQNLSARAEILT